MGCDCGGTCDGPSGLNIEGIGIWIDVVFNKIEELKMTTDASKLSDGLLLIENALKNINSLVGRENYNVEERRTGN
jgi:hypothetical protein